MSMIIDGYLRSKYEFRLVKDDSSTAITPDKYHRYNDLDTGMLYLWDNKQYRDASFFQGYQYSKYDFVERIKANEIYLAQPGHRLLGKINNIDEDTCSLQCHLNNANQLSFSIDRIVDGEETWFY